MTRVSLSAEAQAALVNTERHEGAIIAVTASSEVVEELRAAGMIRVYGLTRKGSITRESLVSALLERAFG